MENQNLTAGFPAWARSFKFRPPPHLAVLAVVFHLAVALPLAWSLNIWLDEGWTMRTTAGGLLNAWQEAIVSENQAPLYFTLVAALRLFGDSVFLVRLFSVVCIAATVALIPPLLRRFLPPAAAADTAGNAPFLLAFVVALHPYSIWASVEARLYALVILLSALLLLFWCDGYCEETPAKNPRKAQAFYFLLAVAGLYTNYYLGFLLFANACALVVLRRWKALGLYVGHMALAGLFFAPLVLVVREQFATNADYYREQTTFLEGLKNVWNILNNFLLPSAEWETTALLRVWSVRFGLIVLLFLGLKRAREIPPGALALAAILAATGLFFMAAYFLLDSTYTHLRHAAPMYVPFLLFFTTLLAGLAKARGVYVWLVLLLIFAPTRLFSEYAPMAKNGDWPRVAKFIEAHEEAGRQPITTFQLQDSIPLRFYYQGKNQVLSEESVGSWRAQGPPLTPARWSSQIELLISQIPAETERLWLVTESYCHEGPDMIECRPLEEFVRENYETEKSADFHMRRVRLLRRKTNRF